MIDPNIFTVEFSNELLEVVLEVREGAINRVGLLMVEILIGEVDSLAVHFPPLCTIYNI